MTSYTNLFKSFTFYTETIFFLFYKTTNLNKEVNRTEPFPSVRVPKNKGYPCGGYLLELKFLALPPPPGANPIKLFTDVIYGFS
jgi:hypothetical protein